MTPFPVGRVGTLRFFGEWFGRPMDNWHVVLRSSLDAGVLRVEFDKGETLEVHQPAGAVIEDRCVTILEAVKVIWRWHLYGEPRTSDTLKTITYTGSRDAIVAEHEWPRPHLARLPRSPAVEFHTWPV